MTLRKQRMKTEKMLNNYQDASEIKKRNQKALKADKKPKVKMEKNKKSII